MGSVINYIECPNCKQEAFNDFYYKTGEEYTFCDSCGYTYRLEIINRDKNLSELKPSDWKTKELKKPFGAFRIETNGNVGFTSGTVRNKQHLECIKKFAIEDKDVVYCSVSRLLRGSIKTEIIINKNSN